MQGKEREEKEEGEAKGGRKNGRKSGRKSWSPMMIKSRRSHEPDDYIQITLV
jgi:hypothetical protein